MRSGSATGDDRNNTMLIRLKIAVFAPIPSARVSTAMAVKPGFFSSWRQANFKSFITQCLHRIDLRRPSRRGVAREDGGACHQQRRHGDTQWIRWRHCVMNDLKFACRQLLKNPGFTAMAVL